MCSLIQSNRILWLGWLKPRMRTRIQLSAILGKISFWFEGLWLINPRWLWGDTRLVVVAGSDTSSSAMTHIFYHLAKEPHIITKIREELGKFYKPGSETELRDLQDGQYLNGVINEALRLHPPVPSGVLRQTPPEGITIGDVFMPGNVTISAPSWSMGRRGSKVTPLSATSWYEAVESCFKHAEEFLPERWGDKPELILNKGVFIPFASGPHLVSRPLEVPGNSWHYNRCILVRWQAARFDGTSHCHREIGDRIRHCLCSRRNWKGLVRKDKRCVHDGSRAFNAGVHEEVNLTMSPQNLSQNVNISNTTLNYPLLLQFQKWFNSRRSCEGKLKVWCARVTYSWLRMRLALPLNQPWK